jgi:hypothetical protein
MIKFNIPIPNATKYNCIEFCSAWMSNYGGTIENAVRVWMQYLKENK